MFLGTYIQQDVGDWL